jgi:3-hydroxyacyl-CoA dehydrogenase
MTTLTMSKVGVVGCGLMGSGIAQTFAQSGYETIVSEVNQELLDKGLARIYNAWGTLVSKGTRDDIDTAMKLGCGYPMGPFTLLDYVGLDTTMWIAEAFYDEYKEPLYAPPPLLRRMVYSGMLGRKSGRGFYTY